MDSDSAVEFNIWNDGLTHKFPILLEVETFETD